MKQSQFFDKLSRLIQSSRSNYAHGRSWIGQEKLNQAHQLIEEYLGDNLEPSA